MTIDFVSNHNNTTKVVFSGDTTCFAASCFHLLSDSKLSLLVASKKRAAPRIRCCRILAKYLSFFMSSLRTCLSSTGGCSGQQLPTQPHNGPKSWLLFFCCAIGGVWKCCPFFLSSGRRTLANPCPTKWLSSTVVCGYMSVRLSEFDVPSLQPIVKSKLLPRLSCTLVALTPSNTNRQRIPSLVPFHSHCGAGQPLNK